MFPPETHVLIVDDMASMRQLIKAQLKGMGFQLICEAEDGIHALEMMKRMREQGIPIELIFCDLAMPRMDGYEFLKTIRAAPETAKIPFIMVTAEGEQTRVVNALKAGVSNFLMKPFSPASLAEKILTTWKRIQSARRSA